jgi:drug/metabolite transporter (DMT)-like permease
VIGLVNSAIPFVLYSIAALYLPAAMEAIFNSMSPMFGALFAALWLGEKLTLRKVIGLSLGVAGVVVMSSLGNLPAKPETSLAIAACVVAPMCYGLAGVYIKKRASLVKPMAIAGGSQLLGGLALMPLLLISPLPVSALSARVVILAAVFALLCSAIAYVIYYKLIADVGPTKALTVTFLIPVFAMFWGVLLIGEHITASMAAGALIILVGTFLVTAPRRKPALKARTAR